MVEGYCAVEMLTASFVGEPELACLLEPFEFLEEAFQGIRRLQVSSSIDRTTDHGAAPEAGSCAKRSTAAWGKRFAMVTGGGHGGRRAAAYR